MRFNFGNTRPNFLIWNKLIGATFSVDTLCV